MKNNYLRNSDEEAIVDFVKGYEELYNKIKEHCMEKARKEFLVGAVRWQQ